MPVLIVGDVHGDIERLFAALKPYPADRWRTFFLGDLDELRADEPLQEWLRARPALIRLPDRTLLQHCGNDQYLDLIPADESDPVEAINGRTRNLLKTGGEDLLWNV